MNILKRHYVRVLRLDAYIQRKVSQNRYAKVLRAAQEHDGLKRLLATALVCINPKLDVAEDYEGLDGHSILSIGPYVTQSEVHMFGASLTGDCNSCP